MERQRRRDAAKEKCGMTAEDGKRKENRVGGDGGRVAIKGEFDSAGS